MNDKNDGRSSEDFGQVSPDFPRTQSLGALPGAQPKILATMYEGKYYAQGLSPPEVFERWCICEDLAAQLAEKSLASKAGKRSHMTESEILEQYYTRLVATGWTSVEEAHWILATVAQSIGWDVIGFTRQE